MAPTTTDDDDHLNRLSNDNNYSQYYNESFKEGSNNLIHQQANNAGHYVSNQLNYEFRKESSNLTCNSKIIDPREKPKVSYGTSFSKSNKDIAKYQVARRGSLGKPSERNIESGDEDDNSLSGVAGVIGSFGWFQLLVLVFSGLREGLVGYDALVMSIILQPESKFLCADNLKATHRLEVPALVSLNRHANLANFSALFPAQFTNEAQFNETSQCYRSLDGGRSFVIDPATNEPARCTSWIFSNETIDTSGTSLVAEWSLVCQYHWLVAFIESAYFFGLVLGNLVWGYYADKMGRRPAYLVAHTIALVCGSLAVVAPTLTTFAICRFISAFGSIGYNIIYSIQVELIGVKHRSFSTIMNHLGWGLGVICVPLVDHLFDNYRPVIAVAPVLSLLMFPWAFWLPESPRWLMAHGKFKEARYELLRAARFNGKTVTPELEKQISDIEHKMQADKFRQQESLNKGLIIGNEQFNHHAANGGLIIGNETSSAKKQEQSQVCSYRFIFENKRLLRDTFILSYVAFTGHLFYYVQTINFAYVKNLSTAANFITSGAGEWVSVIVGAVLLKLFSRRTCMSLFLFLMTCSFTFQSFIDSGIVPELDTKIIITANNGIGTLASLLLVFVALIVNQEVYPTVVRQTGTSITNTLGESGSTLAPLIIQFSRIIGSWRANVVYSIACLLGIVVAQCVTKTDDIELPDT